MAGLTKKNENSCAFATWIGFSFMLVFIAIAPSVLATDNLKVAPVQAFSSSSKHSASQLVNSQMIKIVDGVGRHVEVPYPLRRIVAANGTYGPEMLCSLGASDRIVAVADHAKLGTLHLASFLEQVPGVGRTTALNAEKVVEVNPQVVLLYENFYPYPEAFMDVLNLAGIKMVVMDFHRPEVFDARIRLMGRLLDRQERAESLIVFENRHLDLIQQRIAHMPVKKRPRVYLESYRPFQVVTPRNPDHALLKTCGGINIFNDLTTPASSVAIAAAETIIERNPDIIIKHISTDIVPGAGYGARDAGALEKVRALVMKRPGWEKISAVKTGKVYVIDTGAKATHPSVYCAYLAKWLHPEVFKDVDPTVVYRQWMETFLGIPFKGVYAYPEEPVGSTPTRGKGV
ncbi:ABC transporter substrate-binding protein [Desulfosarcina variabilis]|uniref:ABC transporter substrate-binding protein n=1 Tax=Desulfosarcina variabilis TaxID=2300 RepID=UPI003AFAF907